ncbi:hypothetical protein HYH02_013614 [Chlamydomonas schloesseri]|uniref:Spindle assembly abnormal protein 6 N-terminal domain-containing protein n=1 Tax=Chlamydomonas schloesseri TaxID=2026947 RepID=A0A835T2Q2_9CHLO|nr:hypothetical protein HYH02_013614 [Chlamydomonas schloesseri]|eukprot:KAG2430775.1 hypothetical protein HYH02_013614 [Chlamydomonas schloesseri]
MEDQALQAAFDYPALEELDPSLVDGFQLFYEREVPFELRSAVGVDLPTEVGALEAIRVKILIKSEGGQPKTIRVELTSESNLFFLYMHDLTEATFKQMQESQRLMIEFPDYPTVLMRMLNQCIREPHIYLAVFIMQPTGEGRLDFIQNMEYKFVELLSVRFMAAGEDLVRAHVSYRYNVVKARLQLMTARLADINAMVKVKNPSLLLQLQRTPPRIPGVPPPPQSPAQTSKPFYP